MIQTPAPLPVHPNPPISTGADAWLAWRTEAPEPDVQLSVAELAECHCPDLCNRDHANE
jgi:hypothetical protein